MMMMLTAANGNNDIDNFNDDNDDTDDDGDQYLSRKRVKTKGEDFGCYRGDVQRYQWWCRQKKHDKTTQAHLHVPALVFSIAIVSHDFHEFPWQPCSRSNNNLIRLAFFLAILEENPILARILERLGSNQCRCANGLAPHLWIRHWMASVWRGSWIVMAIPRLFDESTSNIIRESAQAFTDCIYHDAILQGSMLRWWSVQCNCRQL